MSANSVRIGAIASPPTFSRVPGTKRVVERDPGRRRCRSRSARFGDAEQLRCLGDCVLADLERPLPERSRPSYQWTRTIEPASIATGTDRRA
jgi:hypothetical protein